MHFGFTNFDGKTFEALSSVYGTADEQTAIDKCFPQCESISVDYAIMEKPRRFLYVQLI